MAALLCFRLRSLTPRRLARNVSRPDASTTNLVCHARSRPLSSRAATSAPPGRNFTPVTRAPSIPRSPHLVGGREGVVQRIREFKHHRLLVPGGNELRAVLGHADRLDLPGDAELLEQ